MIENEKKIKPIRYRILLWGKGYYSQDVLDYLDLTKCDFVGWIDKRLESGFFDGKYQFRPEDLHDFKYDYIVVTLKDPKSIKEEVQSYGISKDKIIYFWEIHLDEYDIFNNEMGQLKKENRNLKYQVLNAPYEELNTIKRPIIYTIEETIEEIIKNHSSLCRFGDGEFRWMTNSFISIWFQDSSEKMSKRLREVIKSDIKGINIAISDIFGSLENFVESDKIHYRKFLNTDDERNKIMNLLDESRVYFNAFVTRPYWHFPDDRKPNVGNIINMWKKVWKDRNVLLIEGEFVRMGMGNDLLKSAKTVRRILCPYKNSFTYYDEILNTAQEIAASDDLVLISLGPTATILAYDLAKKGYQTIDIGQLDMEYEWYIRGCKEREAIPHKGVTEMANNIIPDDCGTEEYQKQICKKLYTMDIL